MQAELDDMENVMLHLSFQTLVACGVDFEHGQKMSRDFINSTALFQQQCFQSYQVKLSGCSFT